MNKQLKTFFVLASMVIMSVTSCLNETSDPNGGENVLPGNVESLDSQAAAMKTSVVDVKSLQDALDGMSKVADADRLIADLATCGAALEEHIASIEAGADAFKATLEAMQLQKKFAAVIGEIKAYASDLKELYALEAGVKAWIGEDFENLFAALVEEARIDALLKTLKAQDISVDAIISDVEAGLREEDSKNELPVLSDSVAKNIESATELKSSLATLSTELEDGYVKAIQSSSSETKKTLKSLNTKASALLEVSQDTLDELAASIAACETQIADLKDRLTKIEADLETLVGMIQSLTFISEYSEESAIAYYSMNLNQVDANRADEGKKVRNAESNFKLNYLIRPAAAASALADQSLWNNGLTVKGYEAPLAQLKSSVYDFKDLVIEGVTADASTGLVTVTVTNAFTDKFYFKEVGAKVALSVVTGKTDITSKFVEVQPKDRSGKVYAESLTLNPTVLSIQEGDAYQLSAVVKPDDVTDKGCTWDSYGTEFYSIDQSGKLTAKKKGTSPLTVTANATDEWGRTLSAECEVTVTPAVRIKGATYVEEFETIYLELESPYAIDPNSVTWEREGGVATQSYLEVSKEEDGRCKVYGSSMNYDTATKSYKAMSIKCTIDGETPLVLTQEMRVVAKQPKSVGIEGMAYDSDELVIKLGSDIYLTGTISPTSVKSDCFRIQFFSDATYYAQPEYYSSNHFTGVGCGKAPMRVVVTDNGQYNYFYPARDEIERNFTLSVEPYWVETLSLPEMEPMAPESAGTFVAEFTSDVPGIEPTNKTLEWISSDPSVITVDKTTGAYNAVSVGTATITATTTGEWTTKGDPISATCDVRVEILENLPSIGDYYYADGTWSSTYTASATNPVIGVVFGLVDAAKTDNKLNAEYGTGTLSALAVGISEYSSQFGSIKTGYNDFGSIVFPNLGYGDIGSLTATNGYSNSKGLDAYRTANGRQGTNDVEDVAWSVSAPANTSGWYVPSYYEMQLLRGNMTAVNDAISSCGQGSSVGAKGYWISTLKFTTDSHKDMMDLYLFDMSTGDWGSTANSTSTQPLRVVLAF